MNERDFLGPLLEPPAGGLERLRHSIEPRRNVLRFHGRYWLGAGLAMSMAALVTISILVWGRGTDRKHQIHEAVKQALATPAKTYFTNAGYKEIQTKNGSVRILLVASLKINNQ